MAVSKNRGTSKSSILIGMSIINYPFWGITIFGNTHIENPSIGCFHVITGVFFISDSLGAITSYVRPSLPVS